jgi:hypothetical protein
MRSIILARRPYTRANQITQLHSYKLSPAMMAAEEVGA